MSAAAPLTAVRRELVERAFEAFNQREIDAIESIFDPDVEAIPLMAQIEKTVYRGYSGIREWYEHLEGHWAALTAEIHSIHEAPDGRVVVLGRLCGTGRSSKVEVDASVGWLIGFREGRIDHVHTYMDRPKALRAAGLAP